MFETTTDGIRITVFPEYLEDQSDPDQNDFFFAYHIEIANLSEKRAHLKTRHWIITDGDGEVKEVKGEGVVGKQPVLKPGDTFEYTSYCPLKTPVGVMQGTFHMVLEDESNLDAQINPFSLQVPGTLQ